MRISKRGIHFNHHGDELVWIWPWSRVVTNIAVAGNRVSYKIYSVLDDTRYLDLADYWFAQGVHAEASRKNKIEGFSEDDVFISWACFNFRHQTVIVMRNINHQEKPEKFWASLPPVQRAAMLKDVPVLFFPNPNSAMDVAQTIPIEFAETYCFHNGSLIYDNLYKA